MHASARLADRLSPEWEQHTWADTELPSDIALVVVGWPAPEAGSTEALLVASRDNGVPVVVWDEASAGSAPCPFASAASEVVVTRESRRDDYPGVDVRVLSAAVQPRWHNPMRPHGQRVPTAQLLGSAPDAVLDGISSLLGPPTRPDRSHDVVTVRGRGADLQQVRELIAQGTALITADSELAAAVHGVTLVDSPAHAQHELAALVAHPELRRRLVQRGVRALLAEHSTTAAVDALLGDVGLASPRRARPVSAIVPTMRPGQIPHVVDFIARQSHDPVQLILITHGFSADSTTTALAHEAGVRDVRLITADDDLTLGALMNLGVDAADGEYVAKMDDDNFYGAHYLSDLLATFDFSGAQVAGKWAHLTYLQGSGATFLRFPNAENTLTRLVQGGTLVLPRAVASEVRFDDLPRRVDTTFLDKIAAAGGTVYSADRYNFVSVRGASVEGHTWKITDSELLAKPSAELFFAEPWAHAEV